MMLVLLALLGTASFLPRTNPLSFTIIQDLAFDNDALAAIIEENLDICYEGSEDASPYAKGCGCVLPEEFCFTFKNEVIPGVEADDYVCEPLPQPCIDAIVEGGEGDDTTKPPPAETTKAPADGPAPPEGDDPAPGSPDGTPGTPGTPSGTPGTPGTPGTVPTGNVAGGTVDPRSPCCVWAVGGDCDKNPWWMKIICVVECGINQQTCTGANVGLPDVAGCESTPSPQCSIPAAGGDPGTPGAAGPGGAPSGPGAGVTVFALLPETGSGMPGAALAPPPPPGQTGAAGGDENVIEIPIEIRFNFDEGTASASGGAGGGAAADDPNCPDTNANCAVWAQNGECEKNQYWMKPNCQKSCNCCGGTCIGPKMGPCGIDISAMCPFWASIGECSANPGYMHTNCGPSCDCPLGATGGGQSGQGGQGGVVGQPSVPTGTNSEGTIILLVAMSKEQRRRVRLLRKRRLLAARVKASRAAKRRTLLRRRMAAKRRAKLRHAKNVKNTLSKRAAAISAV